MSAKVKDTETEAVVQAVRDAVPALRANGPAGEENRWLPQENLDLLEKAGVFRIAVPEAFGGLDLSLAEQVRVLSEVARGCPSSGWIAFVWATSAWTATLYPDRAQEEVFASGSGRISSAFAPTGTLVPTEGGYVLNGSWRFNSGCRGADWNFTAAVLEHEDGSHEEFMALVPMADLAVADDWDVTSAQATGSCTTSAKDVFVPAHRVASFGEALEGTTGDRSNTGATGRNYALISFIMASAAAAFAGIARGALELFTERLPGRGITYTAWTEQSEHPLTQIQVATAHNKITAAEGMARGWNELLQERADAGVQPSAEERALIRGQVAFAIELCKESVALLYSAAGGSVIMRASHLQRFHRDIQGLSLHALAQLNANLELQGRVLLGKDPDTPFL